MAIETVEIITRDGMSIGLSKSLVDLYNDGDLTPQELAKFSYAAWEAPECNAYATTEIDISSQQGAAVTSQLSYFQSPMGGSNIVSAYVNDLLPTNRLYCFNILLYTDRYYENLTIDNTSDCDVVTDIDLTACAMTLNSAPDENGDVNIDYPDAQTIKRYTSGASSYFHDDDLVKHWNGSSWVRMNNIRPYCVIANDSGIIFITQGSYFGDREIGGFGTAGYNFCPMNSLKLPEGDHIIDQKWNYSQGDIVDYTKTKHLLRWIGNDQEYEAQTWASGTKKAAWDYDDDFFVIMEQTNQVYGIANDEYHIYPKTLNTVKRLIACVGLNVYIGNDKSAVIKPIITGGMVVGYSEDASTPSEIDNITNVTGNNISPFPPGPGPTPGTDEDNTDPVNTAGAPFASGLCHYYALTAGSVLLEHVSDALGTWDIENTHKDLYKNLVSCKLIKPPAAIPTTGSEPFTIYGVKPQYEGADITLPVVSGNPDASFGPYTIDRKFNDFRDYAPYTRVSIYLPYCGWCDLPSHVVGRSVSVKYFTDIIAATCKAVVFCNNNIIAEAAGVIGLDIPFVADNVGAKMQAVTAGMIAALGGGIQLGAGIGTMVSTKSGNGAKAALSGASQYLSGYSQMAMAFNENTTEISGKNGDGCCLAGATNIIIKIVRPKRGSYADAPYTPTGYGHNIGFVSQKQVKVSSVSGLLIADNVDTSGISGATEAERAEIKRVLETGLIVNAAPE